MPEPFVCAAGLIVPPAAVKHDERQVLLWPVASGADVEAVRMLHDAGMSVLAIRLPVAPAALAPELAAVEWEAGIPGIVAMLNDRWGGGRVDAAAQALEAMLADLELRGFIPEAQVSEALGYASLDELQGRLRSLDPVRGTFVPGLGLCSSAFSQAMRRGLRQKPRRKTAA